VVGACGEAMAPAALDRSEPAREPRRQQQGAVDRAPPYPLQRLAQAAEPARRRDEAVEPASRLVAAALAQRWEAALPAGQEAREQDARLQRRPEQAQESVAIPPDLRAAFRSRGQALPTLWPQDPGSRAHRQALRRCLLDKGGRERRAPATSATRIVWRGGAVSARTVPCTVGRLVALSDVRPLEAQLVRLESQGNADEEMAQRRTAQGLRSSQHPEGLARTVQRLRLRHGRRHRSWGPRPRRGAGALTSPQMATAVGVTSPWRSHLRRRGCLGVKRDAETGLSLCPDRPETLEAFRQLRDGQSTARRYGGSPPRAPGDQRQPVD